MSSQLQMWTILVIVIIILPPNPSHLSPKPAPTRVHYWPDPGVCSLALLRILASKYRARYITLATTSMAPRVRQPEHTNPRNMIIIKIYILPMFPRNIVNLMHKSNMRMLFDGLIPPAHRFKVDRRVREAVETVERAEVQNTEDLV